MDDNKITREVYRAYADKIVSVLDKEGFYEQFKNRVEKGSSVFKLAKKRLIQDISIDWIDTIESILPNLDTIVRNPRKFIVQEEDIVDVSLARSISTESVKYLAQHTNMISKVDEKTGDVTPSKILNITKEESFEIYENRFIYTLLLKLKDFVTMRYDKIKKASATQDVLELDIESRFNLPSKKITYRTEYFAQLSFDEVMRLDPDTLTKIERVAKIDRIITDFLSSSFAKSMRNSAPVRPPIMRTNVILKEPNFKKALTLWQFVETYQATAGFSTSDEVEEYDIEDDSAKRLRSMITLNTMVFESLYDQCETDFDMEDKQFADFMRVGQMDFQKDEIERDEYAQKLDNKEENEDEQENIEEVKPQEEEDADKEIPPEIEEKEPEIEEKEVEKEVEKPQEIEKEVVVERPVEVERFKEMPPKADQEEVDLEPDAEKFDQHLFEVRKIFKRPDDDKIKQEEIIKVKDAIDRCLTSYRRIKQEELEERDRQERIRRRREDIEKRATAFKKQREELEKNAGNIDDSALGMDPFSYQKAKIAREKSEEEARKRKEAAKSAIKVNKNENLELEDKNTEPINKAIDEMEKERAKKAERDARIDEHLDNIDAIMPLENDVPIVSRVRKKRDFSIARQAAQIAQNAASNSAQNSAQNAAFNSAQYGVDTSAQNNAETLPNSGEIGQNAAAKNGHISATQNGDYAQNGEQNAAENVDRKPKIRLAKDTKINPWGDDGVKKRRINLTPVDESKVAVGEVHVKAEDKPVLWGGNTDLGNLEIVQAEQKPKRKYTRKTKAQDGESTDEKATENTVENNVENAIDNNDETIVNSGESEVGNGTFNAADETAETLVNSGKIADIDNANIDENLIENNQEIEQEETVKPVSEMRINIGGRIEDTAGMGISVKGENKPVLWGGNTNLGNLETIKTEQKPKRKYTRKPKTQVVKTPIEEAKPDLEDENKNAFDNEVKSTANEGVKSVATEEVREADRESHKTDFDDDLKQSEKIDINAVEGEGAENEGENVVNSDEKTEKNTQKLDKNYVNFEGKLCHSEDAEYHKSEQNIIKANSQKDEEKESEKDKESAIENVDVNTPVKDEENASAKGGENAPEKENEKATGEVEEKAAEETDKVEVVESENLKGEETEKGKVENTEISKAEETENGKNGEGKEGEEKAEEQNPKKPRKKKEKKDPWALSATTLNQKYTTASGKERHFDVIDEDKVSVGGIKFKSGSGIVDPFGDTFDISAKPENHDDEE